MTELENSKLLGKTFLFAEEIMAGMLDLKISLVTVILTFVLFIGGMQFDNTDVAYGQLSSPYANCISMMMKGDFVQLNMDDDCNEAQ